jgi:site-specific recombinase XerD
MSKAGRSGEDRAAAPAPAAPQARVERRAEGPAVILPSGEACSTCRRFLERIATRGLSPHTAAAYAYDLALTHRWLSASGLRLEEVTADDLHHFLASERGRDSHPKSINRRLHTFRQYFEFAVGRDLPGGLEVRGRYRGHRRDRELGLQRLPTRAVRRLRVKEPRTLVDPLTVEQVHELLDGMHRYRDLCIAHAMLLCGLRSQEVLRLRIADCDFDDRRIRVFGKGSKERALPMPGLLLRLVRRYLSLERPRACATDVLFVVLKGPRRGQPMTRAALRRVFRTRRAAPALANANPHRLRHTFGTDMARSGVRLPILQKMMGHAFPETTLQYVNISLADVAAEFFRAVQVLEARYQQGEDGREP